MNILPNDQLKNETLRHRNDLTQFEKTAIHYFNEEGEDKWLDWYDELSSTEQQGVRKMLNIDGSFIERQRNRM